MKTSKIEDLKPPTFEELKEFTLRSYVKLLKYLNKTYTIVPFCRIPREDIPYLILRHDIDVSLSSALKMARIERKMGIKSTYFVLFSSAFYNLFEGDSILILNQISRLGHEIGLHYDPAQYKLYNKNPKKTLQIEIQLLEYFLGKKVYSIARHGPWNRDPFAAIKRYINANHPRFRTPSFIHDSDRAWTPVNDLIKLLNDPPRRVQLLIHPENWQEDRISREALLERFFRDLEKRNLELKKRIKRIWQTDPLAIKYDALIERGPIEICFQENRNKMKKQNKLREALNYYNNLFRWYLINTSLGWNIHRLREIVQKKLSSP